jgi:phosphatidylserine decarboxylase
MKRQQIPVAREGYPFIGLTAFSSLVFALLGLTALTGVTLALTIFCLYFFRDPVRVTPKIADGVISPADGRIIVINEVTDERFFSGPCLKISIFMNIFNVHVNRIPLAGTVKKISFKPGKFYSADKDKAALHNEYCALGLKTSAGISYTVVQVAGLIARRIVCRAEPGDLLHAGERYGLIRFGSRLDLYLPVETRALVSVGERVRAGETVLARIVPPTSEVKS